MNELHGIDICDSYNKTKKKVEIHEINGQEIIFQNEIIIENSHKNSLTNEVEKRDLTYKIHI